MGGEAAAAPGLARAGGAGQVDGVGPGAVIRLAVELGAADAVLLVGGVTTSAGAVDAAAFGEMSPPALRMRVKTPPAMPSAAPAATSAPTSTRTLPAVGMVSR